MNENIDLTKILKDCPKGWKFYSTIYGDIEFISLLDLNKILFSYKDRNQYYDFSIQSSGKLYNNGECVLFPSKDQRDWFKFSAPWYKKERFNPKTLEPFDKVLVRDKPIEKWRCDFYSYCTIENKGCVNYTYPYSTIISSYRYCIPYNDDTKHLVGTKEEAPEYYKYWED